MMQADGAKLLVQTSEWPRGLTCAVRQTAVLGQAKVGILLQPTL